MFLKKTKYNSNGSFLSDINIKATSITCSILLVCGSVIHGHEKELEMTLETEVTLESTYERKIEREKETNHSKSSMLAIAAALGIGLSLLSSTRDDGAKDTSDNFKRESEPLLEYSGTDGTKNIRRNKEPRSTYLDLIIAIQKNNTQEACRLISQGAYLAQVDHEGDTPAHWAYYMDNCTVLITLIKYGANLALPNDKSETVLALLADSASSPETESNAAFPSLLNAYIVNPRQSILFSIQSTQETLQKMLGNKKAARWAPITKLHPYIAAYRLGTSQDALRVITPQ